VAQKKISTALMPMNCASWSITITLISASAANVSCWLCPGPRSTTDPYRCGNRRCESWPGLILSTWKLPAAAAAGWWTTWQEMGSQSAATGCETSCGAWVCERFIRNHAPQFQVILPSAFRAWLISTRSRLSIRSGLPTSPTFLYRGVSFIWWRSWISSPGTCSAGSSPTALTRSFVWKRWTWPLKGAACQRSSTPIKAASSPPPTSWPAYTLRKSRSVGQGRSVATTTSWWRGCGGRLNTRRSICAPTAMAGRRKSAWPASCGGTAM